MNSEMMYDGVRLLLMGTNVLRFSLFAGFVALVHFVELTSFLLLYQDLENWLRPVSKP